MRDSYYDLEHRVTARLLELGDPQTWLVTELQTGRHFRGHGHAGRLLDVVIKDADAEEVTLCLAVQPDGSIDCLEYDALIDFYSRRGFELIEEGAMRREPQRPHQDRAVRVVVPARMAS
jgi:GNAT superfamily N-acetyltransferase